MKKLLCWIGIHKEGEIIDGHWTAEFDPRYSKTYICSRCKEWQVELVDGQVYLAEIHMKLWEKIKADIL